MRMVIVSLLMLQSGRGVITSSHHTLWRIQIDLLRRLWGFDLMLLLAEYFPHLLRMEGTNFFTLNPEVDGPSKQIRLKSFCNLHARVVLLLRAKQLVFSDHVRDALL